MVDPTPNPAGQDPEPASHRLVARMARGDRGALAELYQLHSHTLQSLALRMLRDLADANDLVHDVFLESWRQAASFDPERGSVRSWLMLRTRSRALDRLRSPAKTRRVELELDAREAEGGARSRAEDHSLDAFRLPAALSALTEGEREVLRLGYFEGLTCSEIALSLGIPVGTVKSRTRSALQKLRELYEDDEP